MKIVIYYLLLFQLKLFVCTCIAAGAVWHQTVGIKLPTCRVHILKMSSSTQRMPPMHTTTFSSSSFGFQSMPPLLPFLFPCVQTVFH